LTIRGKHERFRTWYLRDKNISGIKKEHWGLGRGPDDK